MNWHESLIVFYSVQRVHSGDSLHRKAAVEGEWGHLLALNIRDFSRTVEFRPLSQVPGGIIFLKLFSKTDWLAEPPQLHLHILNGKMGKLVSPSAFRTYSAMLCLFGMNMEHYEPFKTLLGHHNSKPSPVNNCFNIVLAAVILVRVF